MIQKSIKIAIRRIVTLKAFSFINIVGMAIAISAGLAILLYTTHHFSFDKYIPDGENSYRIITKYGNGTFSSNTFACFDDVLSLYPEVTSHTVCYHNHNIEEVFVNENKIKVKDAIFVNDSFIDFFGLRMIRGDGSSVNEINTILVTPEMAEKLFQDMDAIGQIVYLRAFDRNQDSLIPFTISGIIEPLPDNSHIKYEMLISQSGHFTPTVNSVKLRKVFGALIYVRLHPSTNLSTLEKNLQTAAESILGGKHGPPLEAFNHKLQPVYDIHTSQGITYEMQPTVRLSSLNILLLVGILIFIIAILNSVIMNITRTAYNQKYLLIIRLHGGNKYNIFLQTLTDVLISVTISFLLSIFILSALNHIIENFINTDWSVSFNNIRFWIFFTGLLILISISISFLSSTNLFQNLTIIKDINKQKGMRSAIPLVIFQFVIVIALIAFALMLNKQMNFFKNKNLGYSSENILVMKIPQQNAKIDIFRNELMNIPGVINAGTARHYPGYRLQDMNFVSENNTFPFKFGHVDQNTIETLGIKQLIYFSEAKDEAIDGWYINETFYNRLKNVFSDEQIAMGNFPSDDNDPTDINLSNFVILGVINDFHYASLHSKIENFAFFIPGSDSRYNRFVLTRIKQDMINEVIVDIENKYQEIYPGKPFNYSFLDEQLSREYTSERLLMRLINAFSILSIIIASMGLIGLSLLMIEKRTKEIGIRKVNGASVYEIVRMINIIFIKWLFLAIIIAIPISYYAMEVWLQNFAYRTQINWWIFFFAGSIALFIVLTTVTWQSVKAARRNPVESLRYE